MRKLFVLFFLLVGFVPFNYAFFEKDLRRLTMQNGLADNKVSCIHKDRDGFMWFGTDNGLSRYDGKNIRNFTMEDRYLKVVHIEETSNHLLWLVTSEGLVCFDQRIERFIAIECEVPLYNILFTDDNRAWSFTAHALTVYHVLYEKDINGNARSIQLKRMADSLTLEEQEAPLQAYCISPEGDIYAVSAGGFIYVVDGTNGILKRKSARCPNINASRLLFHNGLLWIANNIQGVIVYDPQNDRFRQYHYSATDPNPVSHTDIYQIVPLNDGRYVAVSWNGYTVLTPDRNDRLSFTTEIYSNTASEVHRDIENRMISAYYDPAGMLWVGTSGGGVLASDLRLQFYQRFYQDTHNEIGGIIRDRDGYVWMATYHKGVMRSKKPFNSQERISFQTVYPMAPTAAVSACMDRQGDLWFGGHNGVLVRYSFTQKQFFTLPVPIGNGNVYKGVIACIYADEENNIWLGTSQGLLLYDRTTGSVIRYEGDFGRIQALAEHDNHLWIGSMKGLYKFDLKQRLIVRTGYEERYGTEARTIRSLLASTEKVLYIGYAEGFGVMDTVSDSIRYFYTTKEGLSNNSVSCIMEDGNGDIWLGNHSSISRYSRHQRLFYNYYISGNNCSALWFADHLFWGNNMNLTYFDPTQVKHHLHGTDHVRITQIEVDNKPVDIGEKINNQIILTEAVSYAQKIILSQANNSFSLSFSNLTFSQQLQKYVYRLLPLQSEWMVVDEGERASFTNLGKGNYTFEVKSIFPDGSNGEVTKLEITLLPHWYETGFFRLLLFLLIGVGIFLFYRRMKRKQERLAQEERLRHELLVTNLEREKEKQIHRERENFFTNVSHELRTPLTLILSPLQELLSEQPNENEIRQRLELIYANATSLSTLTDQLLYVQKIEAGMVRIQLSEVDIVKLVESVYHSFAQLAQTKQIDYQFMTEFDSLTLWLDVTKVESAVRNLLSNAFKYSLPQDKICVGLQRDNVDGKRFCLIVVEDTGLGIEEELQDRVFDSFITGKVDPSMSTKVGIGLRIVKNTMDLHHGKVILKSKQGIGTRFTLFFPEGRDHFSGDEYEWASEVSTPPTEIIESVYENADLSQKGKKGKQVLVIEDNREMRRYICRLMEKEYEVWEACDGQQGIDKARELEPDLILCDIMMPVKDGFDCCRELKEQLHTASIPVIMLTAKAEDTDLLQSMRVGVDDFLMKPFNPEVLKAKAESLIRSREELKRIYTRTLFPVRDLSEDEADKQEFMKKVITLIEINLTNPDFNAKMLSRELNCSQPTLYRRIKQYTGLSIIEVIRSVRMTKAASYLMEKKYTVQEVCERVGYNDMNTFRRFFTRQFGVSPSRYTENG